VSVAGEDEASYENEVKMKEEGSRGYNKEMVEL
jgi:hypothetical protein